MVSDVKKICNGKPVPSLVGKVPKEGNEKPLSVPYRKNPVDRGPGRLQSHGVYEVRLAKSCYGRWFVKTGSWANFSKR